VPSECPVRSPCAQPTGHCGRGAVPAVSVRCQDWQSHSCSCSESVAEPRAVYGLVTVYVLPAGLARLRLRNQSHSLPDNH